MPLREWLGVKICLLALRRLDEGDRLTVALLRLLEQAEGHLVLSSARAHCRRQPHLLGDLRLHLGGRDVLLLLEQLLLLAVPCPDVEPEGVYRGRKSRVAVW